MQGLNHVSYVSCTGRQVLYHKSHQGSPRQPSNVTKKLLYNIPSLPHWYLLCCLVAKSCPNLCNPWTVAHQAPQARILAWVAISSSRGSSPPRDQIHISCIGRWVLYHWATWEALHWSSQVSYLLHFVFCCDFEVTSFIYPYTQPILGLKLLINSPNQNSILFLDS